MGNLMTPVRFKWSDSKDLPKVCCCSGWSLDSIVNQVRFKCPAGFAIVTIVIESWFIYNLFKGHMTYPTYTSTGVKQSMYTKYRLDIPVSIVHGFFIASPSWPLSAKHLGGILLSGTSWTLRALGLSPPVFAWLLPPKNWGSHKRS